MGHPSPVPSPPGGERPSQQTTIALAVEKRVRFKSWWLPWVLIAPQMAIITGVLLLARRAGAVPERAAAGRLRHLDRVRRRSRTSSACSNDATYLASFWTTAVFSVLVAVLGLSVVAAAGGDGRPRGARRRALQDAADLALRGGAGGGRRAVAVHVRAVGRRRQLRAARARLRLEPPAQRQPRDGADRDGRGVEADLLQLPVLPRRAAVDPEEPDRGRGDRRRRPWRRFWTIVFPLLSPTTFFLLVINIVYAFFETFAHRRRRHRRAARARTPRSWSTRSTTTASRRWTSAARRRSRWC